MIRNKSNRERYDQDKIDNFSDRRSIKSDRDRHSESDQFRSRKHSPPLSSNRSRHSSLSNRSNHDAESSDHELNRKKSGSRLSFADEIESDKRRNASESSLKNMLKSGLNHVRSMESLRDNDRDKSRDREKDSQERDSSRSIYLRILF